MKCCAGWHDTIFADFEYPLKHGAASEHLWSGLNSVLLAGGDYFSSFQVCGGSSESLSKRWPVDNGPL